MPLLSRNFSRYELIGQAPRSRWPCGWWRGQACRISAWSRAKEAATGSQGLPNRWESVRFDRLPVKPVPVWAGTKLAQIQNLNLNSKK